MALRYLVWYLLINMRIYALRGVVVSIDISPQGFPFESATLSVLKRFPQCQSGFFFWAIWLLPTTVDTRPLHIFPTESWDRF